MTQSEQFQASLFDWQAPGQAATSESAPPPRKESRPAREWGLPSSLALVPELSTPHEEPSGGRCELIEGENLQALLALRPVLEGKVDAIYIDPPYNTGSLGFAYADRSAGRGDAERHASWRSFMAERLTVARSILSREGAIFISIDDNEQHHLRLVCDEVFGEGNFVANFVWHKTRKGKALNRTARLVTEYVVCYAKDRAVLTKLGLWGSAPDPELANPFFHRPNSVREVRFPPDVIETNWPDGEYAAGLYGEATDSLSAEALAPFSVKNGKISSELRLRGRFRWVQDTLLEQIAAGVRFSLRRGKFRIVFYREDGHKAPPTLLDDRVGVGTYEEASAEVEALLGYLPFVYPKPVSLVRYLIRAVTYNRPNALVLDFFAGTGTTGQAVAELNAEDGGHRDCVLVTDNSGRDGEGFIAEAGASGICQSITRPRLLKAFEQLGAKTGRPTGLGYWRSNAG